MDNNIYSTVTDGIEVIAEPFYRPDKSDPDAGRWFWAYRITIVNRSETTVQLQSRYWNIIDGNGRKEEVHGPGVVGEHPLLGANDSYQYMSGCPLNTPSGTMEGYYDMIDKLGSIRRIRIPAFSLDIPDGKRILN